MVLKWFFEGQNLTLVAFAAMAVATSFLTLVSTNPLRAAIYLVLNLFSVAGIYLALSAFFLSAVQVIVYAGAIMVLFLFVIMLLNLGSPDRSRDSLRLQLPAGVLSAGTLATFLMLVAAKTTSGPSTGSPAGFVGSVVAVGKELYNPARPWLFPFELTSVLLLVAVVGAVVLARRPEEAID